MKYILYQTINKVNNKFYIGVHRTQNPEIFDGYLGCGCSISKHYYIDNPRTPFQHALKKYGIKNFTRIVLKVVDTLEEVLKLEQEIVNIDFVKRQDTYNIALGGGYGQIYFPINQFDKDGNLVETWDNMVIAAETLGVSHTSINNAKLHKGSCLGYFWSENSKINISEYSYHVGKQTYKYDLQGNYIECFESTTAAAKSVDSKENAINRAINLNISHKNYYWSFNIVDKFIPKKISFRGKTLYIYDLNGNFIKELKSSKEIREYYNCKSPALNIKEAMMLGRPYKNTYISLEKSDKIKIINYSKTNIAKKVGRYSLDGNLLQEYDSVKQATKEYGSGVFRVLNNQQEKTKGFIFKYL